MKDKEFICDYITENDIIEPAPVDNAFQCFLKDVRAAKEEAIRNNIQANAIFINPKMVKIPALTFRLSDFNAATALPAMICGLETYICEDELPENYAFSVAEICTERDRLEGAAKQEGVAECINELLDFIHYETFHEGYELKKVERKLKDMAEGYGLDMEVDDER